MKSISILLKYARLIGFLELSIEDSSAIYEKRIASEMKFSYFLSTLLSRIKDDFDNTLILCLDVFKAELGFYLQKKRM